MARLLLLLTLMLAVWQASQAIRPAQAGWCETVARPELITEDLPQGKLYTVTIPARGYRILPAVSETVNRVPDFAGQYPGVMAIINAGFFDPVNDQTTSWVTVNGTVAADPTQNRNLTGNEKLSPYLPKIFNRSEFRIYQCDDQTRYDITLHQVPVPTGCRLEHSLGGGPVLPLADRAALEKTAEQEAFWQHDASGKVIRNPIGIFSPNARSVIGIRSNGDVIWLMGAQDPEKKRKGFSLADMDRLLKERGAVKAMGLDGGGSSSLYFHGQTYWGRWEGTDQPVQRPVKSVLLALPKK